MKLKKRIFISNTLMLLLALQTLLAVGCMLIGALRFGYFSKGAHLDDQVFTVQSLIDQVEQVPGDWTQLEQELEPFGFQLYVWQEDEVVYPSPQSGMHHRGYLQHFLHMADQMDGSTEIYMQDGITMVGRTLSQSDGSYLLLAMQNLNHSGRGEWFSSFFSSFVIIGTAAIVTLLLLSLFFTQRLAKRITQPIDELVAGAGRIESGDLTIPIQYRGEREFETVCHAFNQMQSHLAAEQAKTAAYEKARTDLVTGISHDLRTPLTSVKGYIKGIQDGVAATPEKQEQYLSIAYQKACDMDVLLQRLFFFSKMETGNFPLFPSNMDLGTFAQRFLTHAQAELQQKNVEISCTIGPGTHPVHIDVEQMDRVLMNLVENAVRYAGVTPLKLSLTVTSTAEGEQLLFADNGNGAPEEQLPHLFEQFYRGDESRSTRQGQGNGLGLYIVKRIVESHDGTITAQNSSGLQFAITLPKADTLPRTKEEE